MIRLGAAAAMIALVGCAEIDDRVRGGGSGLPEVAMSARTDFVVPPGRSRTGLALRTFVRGAAEGEWQQVDGVRCDVTGGNYFRASVVTPVRLVLPDLGPDAPPVTAVCGTGTASGRETVLPAFGWSADERPDAFRRAAWGGGNWQGFERSGPMHYPDLAVELR